MSCMLSGLVNADRNCAAYGLQPAGGQKMPSTTLVMIFSFLHLPNWSIKGRVRKGVWHACVNLCCASSRHAFSRSSFWLHSSCVLPVGAGASTSDRGWWNTVLFSAQQTLEAICLIFFILHNWFQGLFCYNPMPWLGLLSVGQSMCLFWYHPFSSVGIVCMPGIWVPW